MGIISLGHVRPSRVRASCESVTRMIVIANSCVLFLVSDKSLEDGRLGLAPKLQY